MRQEQGERTAPPTITVGVPIYNQADYLEKALEGLQAQTFGDFAVLIYDNASTDPATAEVAKACVARDPRFAYVRQPYNKGPMRNFYEVLKAARSPYFAWRAADDYSDPRFLEVLHGVLESRPDKTLAVGRILNAHAGAVHGENPQPRLKGDGGLADRWALFHKVNASWIYGLYRREALTQAMDAIVEDYGDDPWAFDFLALLPFLLDDKVAVTDQTWFAVTATRVRGPEPDLDRMLGLRRRFQAIGRRFTDPRFPGPLGHAFAGLLLWRYANMRVFKFKRVVRGVVGRALTIRPRAGVGVSK